MQKHFVSRQLRMNTVGRESAAITINLPPQKQPLCINGGVKRL